MEPMKNRKVREEQLEARKIKTDYKKRWKRQIVTGLSRRWRKGVKGWGKLEASGIQKNMGEKQEWE